MKTIKPRTIKDLSIPRSSQDAIRVQGIIDACNMLDDIYIGCQHHPNLLGDCILAKMNLLSKDRIRKNPRWSLTVSE